MARASYQKWQLRENGPLVPVKGRHPWYGRKEWRTVFRPVCLNKFPICTQCEKNPSTVVDHRETFVDEQGYVSWAKFADPSNHRALCTSCHSMLTATYDQGFGNKGREGKNQHLNATGEPGKTWTSSVDTKKLNAALDFDIAELLDGIE